MANNLYAPNRDLSSDKILSYNLAHYGIFLSDLTLDADDGCWRIRTIKLDNKIYQHIMLNGDIHEVFELTCKSS